MCTEERGRSISKFFFRLDSGISKWRGQPNNRAAGVWRLSPPPAPRTFSVHKRESPEQLRRISSNSLAGCFAARTKPCSPGAFPPCSGAPRRSLAGHPPRRGDVSQPSAEECARLARRHPAPSPPGDGGRRPNELTWIRPASLDVSADSEQSSPWKEARQPRCPGLLPTVQS